MSDEELRALRVTPTPSEQAALDAHREMEAARSLGFRTPEVLALAAHLLRVEFSPERFPKGEYDREALRRVFSGLPSGAMPESMAELEAIKERARKECPEWMIEEARKFLHG